jgi:hypothetical protein
VLYYPHVNLKQKSKGGNVEIKQDSPIERGKVGRLIVVPDKTGAKKFKEFLDSHKRKYILRSYAGKYGFFLE